MFPFLFYFLPVSASVEKDNIMVYVVALFS